MLLVVVSLASILAIALTRGGISRRIPAGLIPIMLWLLVAQPEVPWPGVTPAALDAGTTLDGIEAALRTTPVGATIEVRGDGVHPEFLPLLRDRTVRWQPPTSRLGLAALSWPRRVAIGEPVTLRGRVDFGDSVMVKLVAPDGTIDSARTDSGFVLHTIPRAAGLWRMLLVVREDTTSLGIQVVSPPRLRVMVIAGRPDFELPSLVRRLEAQDADVTVRTQLTRDRRRIERFGLTPVGPVLSESVLDSLDLVVLGAGGTTAISVTERRMLAAAIDRGLGLLHLVETPIAVGPITPFALRASGTERSVRLSLDGVVWPGAVRIAPLLGPDSLAYLHDSTMAAVAWKLRVGKGRIAVTGMTQAHRLSLAGHPESEAAWWSTLLGPVLRHPSARWSVADDALVLAGEPVTLAWSGEASDPVAVIEAGISSWARLLRPGDGGPATLRLWPQDSGWISVAAGADTLALLAGSSGELHGIARAIRREAMAEVAETRGSGTAGGRAPLPRWFGWLALVIAVAAAWRPR